MEKLEFDYIPLGSIDVSTLNVRKSHPEKNIDELAESIKKIGVQQPIMVFKKDNRYALIIGQRRYLACKKLGLREIPAVIATVEDDTEALIKSFSENIHRLDLEYRDKMQVAMELLSKLGSIDKVATHLGVTPLTVKNYLGYSAVPEPIKKMVDEGKLSATTALQITKSISDENQAIEIAKKVKETPRSEDRRKIIEIAKECPSKTSDEIIQIVQKQKFRTLTIHLTERLAGGLDQACKEYNMEDKDVVLEALEEWLRKKGFLQ